MPLTSSHTATDSPELARTGSFVLDALRWNLTVRTATQIVSWLITILVARLLTPSDYGLMGLAQIAIGFCLLVNHLGAIPALVQKREIAPSVLRQTFALVILSNSVLYLVLFICAPCVSNIFSEPRLTDIIRVLALGLLIGAFSAVPYALLQRDLNFKWMSLIEFAANTLGALTTLTAVIFGNGVWGLVLGNLATGAVTSAGVLILTRFRLLPQFRFAGFGPILSFGLRVSTSGILWYLNRSIPELIIGKTLGSSDLGSYTMMNDCAMLPLNKVLGLTNQIAFAGYSRIQENRDLARHYFFESTRIVLLVLFPIAWGMAAVANDLVAAILGPRWIPAALVLQIIALGVPLRAFSLMIDPLVNGLGHPELSLRNTLTGTLIVTPAVLIGLPWGLIGMCITYTLGSLLTNLVVLRRNLPAIGTSMGQLLCVCVPSTVSAGLMYTAVWTAQATFLSEMSVLWRLLCTIMLGIAVYVLMTLLVNRKAAGRILQIISIRRLG